MWKTRTNYWRILAGLALVATMSFGSVRMRGQSAPDKSQAMQPSREQSPMADRSSEAPAQKIFTGVIARSGDKLVLTDPLTKTSYQLDDQRRANELVNKNVKVTGVLDPSTGTIHVTAIDEM